MVFYRKYRPQTIDELDSVKVKETLNAVLSAKEIPHALLFTGPKGLGKTSTARIVAKVVNCETHGKADGGRSQKKKSSSDPRPLTPDQIEPCNHCEQCFSITNGTNVDVLEIDGASNRGIDEIRDLREKVHLAPAAAKKKVYIIDEVHMLTTEAFNALLKTIEEPPAHVMFIFCTTEPHKVPATIVSRCFHISFNLATEDEIVHSLKRIVAGEKIDIDDKALREIAKMSDHGFRDAAKMLEEVSLLTQGGKITENSFTKLLHKTIPLHVASLLGAVHARNLKSGLQVIADLVTEGVDIKFFITQALTDLHTKLLITSGVEQVSETRFPENLRFEISDIKAITELLSKAYQETKYAVLPQLPLELAIIEWCQQKEGFSTEVEVSSVTVSSSSDKPTMDDLLRKQRSLKVKNILDPKKILHKPAPTVSIHEQKDMTPTDEKKSLLENLIYKTKPYNHSVAAVLRGCKIASFDKKTLVLQTAYKFHKERLDETKTRAVIEKAIKEITGNALEVRVELRK